MPTLERQGSLYSGSSYTSYWLVAYVKFARAEDQKSGFQLFWYSSIISIPLPDASPTFARGTAVRPMVLGILALVIRILSLFSVKYSAMTLSSFHKPNSIAKFCL